jgi:hypothetical protein
MRETDCTDSTPEDFEIRKWVEDNYPILEKIADSVFKDDRNRNLLQQFSQSSPERDEFLSELAAFLLHSDKMQEFISGSQNRNSGRGLKISFIRHLKDRIRKKDKEYISYLRARLLKTIRSSAEFEICSHNSFPAYYRKGRKGRRAWIREDDLREIPFPLQKIRLLTQEGLRNGKNLHFLIGYFWENIEKMWHFQPLSLQITDLIKWIALHIDLKTAELISLELAPAEKLKKLHQNPPPLPPDPETAEKQAAVFANRLKTTEMEIWFYRFCLQEVLESVAEKTSYKSPSSVSSQLDKIMKKCKIFIMECPDLDKGESGSFSVFAKKLCEILENRIAAP